MSMAENVDALGEADERPDQESVNISEISEMTNVMEMLDEAEISEIGQDAVRGFDSDWASLAEWRDELSDIRKMVAQETEDKTSPWPGASNVKYPLITTVSLQYNARAYPALMNNNKIVKDNVIGNDPEGLKEARAKRISTFMSHQLVEDMPGWEEDFDRLLALIPAEGCVFRKVSFDEITKKNVSYLCLADEVVVDKETLNIRDCPRISQPMALYPFEIEEKIRAGLWRDPDLAYEDDQEPEDFIEQATLIDIDDDGYPEPYIVTFVRESGAVVRIAPNFRLDDVELDDDNEIISIPAKQYFVKYYCLPNITGNFYNPGFGKLLLPINNSIDSLLNMMIDAGQLSNTGGGFLGKGFRAESGSFKFSPGEWKKVDVGGGELRQNIMELPVREPSNVLFLLLGMLMEAGKDVSSTQEVMTGGGAENAPVGTTLALIEQGLKVYSAIFKRNYLSLKEELRLLYDLNREHLTPEEYQRILDEEGDPAEDFDANSKDVYPAADPAMSTEIQKAARSQVLLQFVGWPNANTDKILIDALSAQGFDNPEQYLAPPPQGPSPDQMERLAELKLQEREVAIKEREAQYDGIAKIASSLKDIADADEAGADNILNTQELMLAVEQLETQLETMRNEDRERIQRLEGEQPMVLPAPGQGAGAGGGQL